MNREDKIIKRKNRAKNRRLKNIDRNKNRWKKSGKNDCPFDVEMNNMYGTCNCGGENYSDCLGDI